MSQDPRAVLDALDEAHVAGHELPWSLLGGTHDCEVITDRGNHAVSTHFPADAALIVAAVSAVPHLTAAVRAALALADELIDDGVEADFGVRLRSTVTAALTEVVEPVTEAER